MILGEHRAPGRGAQRRDRHREGIVGIVLIGVPGLQQPHPGGQLGRHIQHLLPGGNQLLGQQMPQPVRTLHSPRPAPATPPPTPAAAPPWDGQASTRSSPSGSSPTLIATAVGELLRGPIPIITSAISTLPTVITEPEAAAGMPNSSAGAHASFEPRCDETRRANTSF